MGSYDQQEEIESLRHQISGLELALEDLKQKCAVYGLLIMGVLVYQAWFR